MSRFTLMDWAKIIITAPEIIFGALTFIGCFIFRDKVWVLTQYFSWDQTNFILAYFGVPTGLCCGTYKYGKDITEHERKISVDSGVYYRIKNRIHFSLFVCAISLAASIASFFLIKTGSHYASAGTLTISTWASAIISFLTVVAAEHKFKEIIDIYK